MSRRNAITFIGHRLRAMTSRLDLEYDGIAFAGWARQPGQRTVQEEVETALCTVLREEVVSLTVAGRTDAGVHAWGQVCSYEHEAVDPLRLNALLPAGVAILQSNPAPDGFDARRDAGSRTYCYRVLNRRARSVWLAGRSLWHHRDLDRGALLACAHSLPGIHDFTAFTPTETYHERFERDVLAAEWRIDGDLLEFWITADTFMRHMNRILVGTMLEVATGNRSVEDFVALLDGAPRPQAGATAPAHGLALASVAYPTC
jgi:tRNA pseudouridine38-40 synthase